MELQDRVRAAAHDGQLPCALAHKVADELGVMPEVLGAAAKEAGIRITRCQMGLFGYGPKGTPSYRVVRAADHCPEDLTAEAKAALVDSRLPCRAAWALAKRRGLTYRGMGDILEAPGLKVKPCKLGQF
jgi:hypothetical protein